MRRYGIVLAAAVTLCAAGSRAGAEPGRVPRWPRRLILAQAAPSAQCEALEVLATTGPKKGVDAKLDKVKAKLQNPPFTAYDTFELAGDQNLTAAQNTPVAAKLATGGKLTLLFKDVLVKQGGKARLRMGVDVDNAAGKRAVSTTVAVDAGTWNSPYAGEKYKNGVYILFLSCATP